jgi:hypothetical protein
MAKKNSFSARFAARSLSPFSFNFYLTAVHYHPFYHKRLMSISIKSTSLSIRRNFQNRFSVKQTDNWIILTTFQIKEWDKSGKRALFKGWTKSFAVRIGSQSGDNLNPITPTDKKIQHKQAH